VITKENPVRGETAAFSGRGTSGSTDGPAPEAAFYNPSAIAFDGESGAIYVADWLSIRRLTPDGAVSTIAARLFVKDIGGFGSFGHQLYSPGSLDIGWDGIVVDPDNGNIYLADTPNNVIREITPQGVVRTFAGSGNAGHADGIGLKATFSYPAGITYNSADHSLYVTELRNNDIRRVTSDGTVTTFVGGHMGFKDGTGVDARFTNPGGIAYDSNDGNLYVVDSGNLRIRGITPHGEVSTLSGNGQDAIADGSAAVARFHKPDAIAYSRVDGFLYVTEHGEPKAIDPLYIPIGQFVRALPGSVRRISPAIGEVTTIAGNRTAGYAEGLGPAAEFTGIRGITVNSITGVLYVTDTENQRVREIR
jgi:DNA-binding beta-propeller fold protein YncE